MEKIRSGQLKKFSTIPKLIFGIGLAATTWPADSRAEGATSNVVGWSTNGSAVYARLRVQVTNAPPNPQFPVTPKSDNGGATPDQPSYVTNMVFDHFLPGSLNNLVWTNFIARTNGRDTTIWSVRSHSLNWPATPPVAVWNTNCLIWGMKGATALSPCWEVESGIGQVPVTALTRRHGYTRGHGMGPAGFNTNFTGKKVWFVTTNNTVVEATVVRDVVRTRDGGGNRDYTILLFSHDLPPGIAPLRVVDVSNVFARYPRYPYAPQPLFLTEQSGHVSAEVPGYVMNTWKAGDSGSPDMLPMPDELVFYYGRSTSGPSPEMQADMDQLCESEGLDPKRYQLQWVDLSGYPTY